MSVVIPDVIDRDLCEQLDAGDPLGWARERFVLDNSLIYLDGNSLGALPRGTVARIAHLVEHEWGQGLVRSWTDAEWMRSPLRVGGKVAQLLHAGEDEVLVTDTTSVDLFKLITAALVARPRRRVVLSEEENFPTDLYVSQGVTALLDARAMRRVPRESLMRALDKDVAIVALTHVDYRTGAVHDMRALTDAAHRAGALVLWDLSHSAGAIPIDLNGARVDLAVGCGYKYLNGGPGAPAYLFVSTALQKELRNPIQGWLGHAEPFNFEIDYRPAAGIRSWMSGSPPVVAIAALEVAVDLALEAGAELAGEKARALTELFIRLVDARLARWNFDVASPRDAYARGAQVSLRHADGYPIVRALIDRGVIGDFRLPDLCRFGFAPLYTRYVDVWDAVDHIVEVMQDGAYRRGEYLHRAYIT